jgi:hypothetical protein
MSNHHWQSLNRLCAEWVGAIEIIEPTEPGDLLGCRLALRAQDIGRDPIEYRVTPTRCAPEPKGGMPLGPGKYDDQLQWAMLQTRATSGCLVLFHGNKGTGISCKIVVPPGGPPRLAMELGHRAIAQALRNLADDVEAAIPELLEGMPEPEN